jgi:transposase
MNANMNYLGIDVSKLKLDCALLRGGYGQKGEGTKRLDKTFANNKAGLRALLDRLVAKLGDAEQGAQWSQRTHILMEPTGVYHERAALWLTQAGCTVCLVNPARLRSYATAIGVTSKNDRIDSYVLARYGAAEQPAPWQPPSLAAQTLNALLARREALCQDIQREENRREKTDYAMHTPAPVKDSIAQTLAFLNQQRAALDRQIDEHIDGDPTLKENDRLLQSIKGVGPRVAQRMNALMSTHCFKSAKALAAYMGLVPSERQSGSSVRGKTRLSKQGPAALRQLLYLPAVVAKRHNVHVKAIYERLIARGKPKMSAIGAAMRKLVHLCFGVIHSRRPYDPNWHTHGSICPQGRAKAYP